MTNVKVIKDQENPQSTEILAEAIVRIGEAADKLHQSGLNDHAIFVLIQHETKLPMRDIKLVFDSMRKLKGWYCRK